MIAGFKADFERLEDQFVAALYGFGRPRGTQEEVFDLRKAVLCARDKRTKQSIFTWS